MDRRYEKRMKRYWDKMREFAVRSFSNLDPNSWFDYWHCHIDWQGKGDKRQKNRESSIKLGYEILKMAEDFTSKTNGPIQFWWFIHESSYDDAIYLHSPNDNGTPYPYDFAEVTWGKNDNKVLAEVVDTEQYKIGTIINEHGTIYVITPLT
jgi:hypothetical protein